jgi:hypothetical protein
MKNLYISLCWLLMMQGLSAQTFKSGIILCGGTGNLSGIEYDLQRFQDDERIMADYFTGESQYKMNVGLGYKFRIMPKQKPYFFDLSLIGAIKKTTSSVTGYTSDINQMPAHSSGNGNQSFIGKSNSLHYNVLLDITGNCKIFKGLYAGIGLAPSLYFEDGFTFDLPPVGKIGWDLKYMDIAIAGRMGLFNTLKSEGIKNGRMNDVQVQMFIPF